MNYIIRMSKEQDIVQLEYLFLITRRKTFTLHPKEKFQLGDYIESVAGEEVWVADYDSLIVGFVSMWLQDNFIHNLFVHPDWQGKGIGTALLRQAESRLVKPMELKVKVGNLIACKFYQKHGWQQGELCDNDTDPCFSYRKI
jgi:ribosomal protein S18 acetylase RimI-like enzyme